MYSFWNMQLFSFPSLIHDYSCCKHEASLHILQSLCSAYHWPSFCNSTTRQRWTQSGRGRPSKHGVKTQEVRRSETRGHVRNKIKQELRNLMLPACLDDSQFNCIILQPHFRWSLLREGKRIICHCRLLTDVIWPLRRWWSGWNQWVHPAS